MRADLRHYFKVLAENRAIPITLLITATVVFVVSWWDARSYLRPPSLEKSTDDHTRPMIHKRPFHRSTSLVNMSGAHHHPALHSKMKIDGATADGRIALTFDDGPHPVHTGRLLDILARHRIRATFFVNGYWLDPARPNAHLARNVLLRAHREGHTIGNHTYNHAMLSDLAPEQQEWEILTNEVVLTSLLGIRTTLFRPPYGQMTPHARRVLRRYGYVEARWNAAADDEKTHDPEVIVEKIFKWLRAYKGGIVLLHDRFPWSVEAAERLLTRLETSVPKQTQKNKDAYHIVGLEHFIEAG